MKVKISRFADNGDTSLGLIFIDGIFQCFTVEDEQREKKVMSETRIPEGTFEISLRNAGRINTNYLKKFGEKFHKGMLCIHNAPNWEIIVGETVFKYVMIHIGNTDDHTAGCPLLNSSVSVATFTGKQSTTAYKKFYPIVRDALLNGERVTIEIEDIEKGK